MRAHALWVSLKFVGVKGLLQGLYGGLSEGTVKIGSQRESVQGPPGRAVTAAFSEPRQLLAAYFKSATVGLAICDRELRFQAVNPALALMNGVSARDHLGKTLREILGNAAGVVETAFRSVFATGQPVQNLEVAVILPTRKEIGYWMENYFPVKDVHGRVKQVGAVVIEITEQKKLEESLHQLSGKLLRVKDAEQQRVARELHDSINQYHAAIKMNLRLLSRSNLLPRKCASVVAQSLDLVEHCIAETRTISHLLHPPSLDKMGFASAAQWYAKGFGQRSGIRVNLRLARLRRLSPEVEIALFRVLQEALTNVHRHAQTSAVDIVVSRQGRHITLLVRDYGRGIGPRKLRLLQETTSVGVGLASMRERVHELGGQLQIRSSDEGTEVEVVVPMPAAKGRQRESQLREAVS